jgi:hypothetical protein
VAIKANVLTDFGDERELYIRVHAFEQLANHGVPAIAVIHGYASKEAWDEGLRIGEPAKFLFQRRIQFPYDAGGDPWPLAYAVLKEFDFAATERTRLDEIAFNLAQNNLAIQKAGGESAAALVDAPVLTDEAARLSAKIARADALTAALAAGTGV